MSAPFVRQRVRGRRSGIASQRGAALVELALSLPLLAVIMLGTIDFGRAFRTAMVLTNAARAGAQQGATSSVASGNTAAIAAAATAVLATNNLSAGPAPTVVRTCTCGQASGPSTQPVSCTVVSACSTGSLSVTVSVAVTRTFTLTGQFLGLPSNIPMTRTAVLRAQ